MVCHRLFLLLALLTLGLLPSLGCSKPEPEASSVMPHAVLIDTKSGEVFRTAKMPTVPATNPKTGKPTLMPAMYCDSCKAWHPVPPPQELMRSPKAQQCQKSGTQLTTTGPVPDNAAELPTTDPVTSTSTGT